MATLQQALKYQKRLRDKEYRLRKKGAKAASVAKNSPRVPAKELKSYSPSQLDAYIARANAFNKGSKYDVAGNGDLIPASYGKRIKELLGQRNKWIAAEESRLKRIAPEDWWTNYVTLQKGVLKNTAGSGVGLLTQVNLNNIAQPSSLEAAKIRMNRLEKRKNRRFGYYRNVQRKNMIAQLETLGLYDLSNIVRKMSNDSFDILSSVSPVWNDIVLEYSKAKRTNGMGAASEREQEATQQANSRISEFIHYAAAMGMKKPGGGAEKLSDKWKANVQSYFAKREEENYDKGLAWAQIHAQQREKRNQGKRRKK